MQTLSRRHLLGLALSGTGAVLAAQAHAGSYRKGSDRDPADRLPRRYSVYRFLRLSKAQVYDLARAVRLNRTILIEGYTRSESRDIINLANKDLAAAHAILKR